MNYTAEQRKGLINTCRKWKHPMAVEKAFHLLKEGDHILDYGCGKYRTLVHKLRRMDYVTDGCDLSFPEPWRWRGNYDVVIASNVLNVQPSHSHLAWVLEELRKLSTRLIIFNYPNKPRKLDCPARMLRTLAAVYLKGFTLEHTYYGSGTLTVATRKED